MTHATFGQPAQVGERVGAYELTEKLEESAALVTFSGRDPLLDRRVVVRQVLIPPDTDGDAARETLRQRVDRFGHLARHHDSVASVIEVVDDPRGMFVVTEQAEGDTLDARLAHGKPITPKSVLLIIRSVALALEPMHEQGMVHRDLRPGGLVLTKAGAVQLGDIGLAGMVAGQEAIPVTAVRYMSPELCRGEPGDARSDLYSLGMIAYEMLLGRDGFNEVFSAVLRDTRHQVVRWVKWHTNVRNIALPVDEVNAGVPPVLSQIVARLMDKDPARRIASARQLLETIERHFDRNQPAAAPAPTPATEGKSPSPAPSVSTGGDTVALPPRRKRPWSIIGAVAALVLVVCGYFIYQGVSTAMDAAARDAQYERVLRDAEQAYKAGDFEQSKIMFSKLAGLIPSSPRVVEISEAGALRCDAHLLLAEGKYDEAAEAIDKVQAAGVFNREAVRELAEEIAARRTTAQGITDIRAQMAAGDLDAARRALNEWRSVVVSDAHRGQIDQLYVELQGHIAQQRVDDVLARADELAASGQLDEAITELAEQYESLRAPRLQDRIDELIAQRKTQTLVDTAEAAEASGDWPAAITAYSEATRFSDDASIAQMLANAKMEAALTDGRRLYEAGDADSAAAAFTRALGYGDSAEARGYLARMEASGRTRALVRAGDDAVAVGEFAAAIRHYESAMQYDDTDETIADKLSKARLRLAVTEGQAALERGATDDAQALFEAAQAIDPDAPGVAEGLNRLAMIVPYTAELERGDALLAEGQYVAAKRAYGTARGIMDTPQVRARQDDAEYEHLLAQARSFMEALRWDAATAKLQNAAKIHDTALVRELMQKSAEGGGNG